MIEVFPGPDASGKVLYLVAYEMNERYKLKALKDFSVAKEQLLFTRRSKYSEAKTVELCDIQNP